jgi:hypothetical protein
VSGCWSFCTQVLFQVVVAEEDTQVALASSRRDLPGPASGGAEALIEKRLVQVPHGGFGVCGELE